jgi:hypothetical protein
MGGFRKRIRMTGSMESKRQDAQYITQTQQNIGTRAASGTLRKISEYAKFCSREILRKNKSRYEELCLLCLLCLLGYDTMYSG